MNKPLKTLGNLLLFCSIISTLTACSKSESKNIRPVDSLAATKPMPFSKNLLFDEQGYKQFRADLKNNPTELARLYEKDADAALSHIPRPVKDIHDDGGVGKDAARADGDRLLALAFKSLATDDPVARQPYLQKAAEILKAWAKVNVPSWHRPNEANFLKFYEAYSILRSAFIPADRDTIDTWIRNRATKGSYNMSLQNKHPYNMWNNWESIRICFLFYSAYILDDSDLLTKAGTDYNTFLDHYLLPGGKTEDYNRRSALQYHAFGLRFVGLCLRAVGAMEGLTIGKDIRDRKNKIGQKISDALAFWEPYLCGQYHREFEGSDVNWKNGEGDQKRDDYLTPYNPKSTAYIFNTLVYAYPEQIYPYIRLLTPSKSVRFISDKHRIERYVSTLNTPDIETSSGNPATVQVYQHCNYEGYSAPLPIGGYPADHFAQIGVAGSHISSVRIPATRRVLLYEGNFTDPLTPGRKKVILDGQDNPCLIDSSASFNEKTSSVIVVNKWD